ncbi:MAG: hypothetical protein ABIP39_10590, partial [Polyangiaceae bacterium]
MGAIAFLVFFLLVSGFGHGTVLRWAIRVFPIVRRHQRRAMLATGALILVTPVARIFAKADVSSFAAGLLGLGMVEVMVVIVAALPILLVGVLATALPEPSPKPILAPIAEPDEPAKMLTREEPSFGRRLAIEKVGGLAVLGASGAALGWGMIRGR